MYSKNRSEPVRDITTSANAIWRLLLSVLCAFCGSTPLFAAPGEYFAIQVVDDQTGRGVPLVELQTTNDILHYTDSNGLIAFNEPGLMGTEVYFHVKSHGYEYPADGFGYRGVRLTPVAGGNATVKIKRINIAQRLYRITGEGIYRDTLLLGRKAPTANPVINGLVLGCDSVLDVEYQGKLFWFWGDTNRPSYPLGNFFSTGATSLLPDKGGLDPDTGVDFTYFVDQKGFAKGMTPFSKVGPTWPDAFVSLKDETGRERMYCAFANVNQKMETLQRGLAVYNDEKRVFEKIADIPLDTPAGPAGHPFRHTVDGKEYIYYTASFPFRRVVADVKHMLDLSSYEAFTCLQPGTRVADARIDRDAAGRVRYGWKRNTPPLSAADEKKLVEEHKLRADEVLIYLRDTDTGKAVNPHASSIYWNDYRKRWVLVICESMGTSMLGEIWYAEADTPVGPWVYARKIVTHNQYTFYNPKQHPNFAKDGGRTIYFEGTYANTFSGNLVQTPRYDYNQMMYKLDLADPRMVLPVPVYVMGDARKSADFATAPLPANAGARPIAFFAPDRVGPGTIAITATGQGKLSARPADAENGKIVFYALPADTKNPPAAVVPLYEFRKGDQSAWSTSTKWSSPGYRRTEQPLCLVWPSPTTLEYPQD